MPGWPVVAVGPESMELMVGLVNNRFENTVFGASRFSNSANVAGLGKNALQSAMQMLSDSAKTQM